MKPVNFYIYGQKHVAWGQVLNEKIKGKAPRKTKRHVLQNFNKYINFKEYVYIQNTWHGLGVNKKSFDFYLILWNM